MHVNLEATAEKGKGNVSFTFGTPKRASTNDREAPATSPIVRAPEGVEVNVDVDVPETRESLKARLAEITAAENEAGAAYQAAVMRVQVADLARQSRTEAAVGVAVAKNNAQKRLATSDEEIGEARERLSDLRGNEEDRVLKTRTLENSIGRERIKLDLADAAIAIADKANGSAAGPEMQRQLIERSAIVTRLDALEAKVAALRHLSSEEAAERDDVIAFLAEEEPRNQRLRADLDAFIAQCQELPAAVAELEITIAHELRAEQEADVRVAELLAAAQACRAKIALLEPQAAVPAPPAPAALETAPSDATVQARTTKPTPHTASAQPTTTAPLAAPLAANAALAAIPAADLSPSELAVIEKAAARAAAKERAQVLLRAAIARSQAETDAAPAPEPPVVEQSRGKFGRRRGDRTEAAPESVDPGLTVSERIARDFGFLGKDVDAQPEPQAADPLEGAAAETSPAVR